MANISYEIVLLDGVIPYPVSWIREGRRGGGGGIDVDISSGPGPELPPRLSDTTHSPPGRHSAHGELAEASNHKCPGPGMQRVAHVL